MYRYVKIQLRREWTISMMNPSSNSASADRASVSMGTPVPGGQSQQDGFFFSYHGLDGLDGLACGGIDQKVSVGLGGVPPWAFRHRSLLKTSLGSSPMTQFPVLTCRTF